jgi:hypothetical protein
MRFLPVNNNVPGWQAGSVRRDDWSPDMTSFKIPQPVKVGNLLEQVSSQYMFKFSVDLVCFSIYRMKR